FHGFLQQGIHGAHGFCTYSQNGVINSFFETSQSLTFSTQQGLSTYFDIVELNFRSAMAVHSWIAALADTVSRGIHDKSRNAAAIKFFTTGTSNHNQFVS